jgi:hypothetical protein
MYLNTISTPRNVKINTSRTPPTCTEKEGRGGRRERRKERELCQCAKYSDDFAKLYYYAN